MINTYRATGSVALPEIELGDLFEHEFAADEESDLLAAGRIEIVPRAYRVVGTSRVLETDPGDELLAALTVAQEAQLIAGGHLKRRRAAAVKPKGEKGAKDTGPEPAAEPAVAVNDETKE